MTDSQSQMRTYLRDLDRAFVAFERGDHDGLYESRESLSKLVDLIEEDGWFTLTPICEIATRLLGTVLVSRGLSDVRAVRVVRDLLEYVEAEIARAGQSQGDFNPGGVFHVVNSNKVGELLIERGHVKSEDLEKALVLQRVRKGRRVGEVLVAMNVIDQRTLNEVLDIQRRETRSAEMKQVAKNMQAPPGSASLSDPPSLIGLGPLPGADSGPAPFNPMDSAPPPLSLEQPPAEADGDTPFGDGAVREDA
ncbi:MAG: hypothetical protein AAF726_12165 [Planctomycetota bacterium]